MCQALRVRGVEGVAVQVQRISQQDVHVPGGTSDEDWLGGRGILHSVEWRTAHQYGSACLTVRGGIQACTCLYRRALVGQDGSEMKDSLQQEDRISGDARDKAWDQ